jgi:hypothetical protein
MGLWFAVQSLIGLSCTEPVTILYCLIWDSPTLEGQVPVFISPRNRVAGGGGTGFPFCLLLRLAGVQWRYSNPCPHTTLTQLKKLKWTYDRQSVGQSVLMLGSHLKPVTRFLFSVWRLRVSWCGAPSLTRGRVCNLLYNWFWSLPEQSLSGPSPAGLRTIFYFLIWDSPNLEGQVPVFTSPRNRVA